METTIYLCRHGETDWNKKKMYQGASSNSSLSEEGKKQSELLGKHLATKGVDIIFSGPASRCTQTAEAVSRASDISVVIIDDLKERSMGILEGKTHSWYRENYPESYETFERTKEAPGIEGVESFKDVIKRSLNVIGNITKENEGKNIAIMSHRGLLKAFITGASGKSPDQFDQNNCCINVIKHDYNGFRVENINDTSHLRGE
jgi:broad specificity phosphatase PhoE